MKFSFVPILVCTYILLCFSALTEESRAINLFKEVRCLVCQGQTIHESNAEIAEDLKKLILEKIDEGETDKEIKGAILLNFSLIGFFFFINPSFLSCRPFLRDGTFML